MKILVVMCATLLVCGALPAQTTAKGDVKSAGLGKAMSESDQELNIRAYIELLRTDVQKAKSEVMGEVMHLDTDQATKFWPIYKSFETDLQAIGERVVTLLKDYTAAYNSMTNDSADKIAGRLLDLEQDRNALKRKYYDRFKTALDPITATRFLQVENQLERLVDLQIAASLPVIR